MKSYHILWYGKRAQHNPGGIVFVPCAESESDAIAQFHDQVDLWIKELGEMGVRNAWNIDRSRTYAAETPEIIQVIHHFS